MNRPLLDVSEIICPRYVPEPHFMLPVYMTLWDKYRTSDPGMTEIVLCGIRKKEGEI